jgi:hypothetical protein
MHKYTLVFFVLMGSLVKACLAANVLYYSNTDGSVIGVDVNSGTTANTIPSNLFSGAIVGASREMAFDPTTRLLWYTATDNAVYSVNVDTRVSGPSISSGRITGAAVGAERHIFIDYSRRYLMLTTTSGAIQRFTLDTQTSVANIPSTLFTDGNVGTLRHLASDIRNGNIWYAATNGSFREFNPDSLTHTGRQISFGEQVGANPGAYRHFVIDPNADMMYYAVTDGSLSSISLSTLKRGSTILGSNVFAGANPGAGRIVSFDVTGTVGGRGSNASFVSNYVTLPFVILGPGSYVTATLFYDAAAAILTVTNAEVTTQAVDASNATTYDSVTGVVTIPKLDFLGTTYRVNLNQIPGTLTFSVGAVTLVRS